jgi:hypothetical protein
VFVETAPPRRKTFFLIRHGQSKWNEAQAKMNIKGLLDYDHALTEVGINQARDLNQRWREYNFKEAVLPSAQNNYHLSATPPSIPTEEFAVDEATMNDMKSSVPITAGAATTGGGGGGGGDGGGGKKVQFAVEGKINNVFFLFLLLI